MAIKIVTDSTCDLPEEIIHDLEISVVPLYINIGDQGYLDGVEISRKEFYSNLPDYPTHPTTGTPGAEAFKQVFNTLANHGADEILSIHISEKLSGTIDIARAAAQEFERIPVMVRDSGQLSLGTGFQVELAAKMAQEGKSMAEILKALDDLKSRTLVSAGLETLEFLRRSGRMNKFMHGIGSLLQVKPILTMKNGLPGSERVRTIVKAEKRLLELLEENIPIERIALLHTNAQEKAQEFLKKVADIVPEGKIYFMDITPVIGAHIGPGAIGFAIISKKTE
jgi:DegV family protein with EDD domain